jgi:methyl-accepting chemotaxis protein
MFGGAFGKETSSVINQLRITVTVLSLFAVFNLFSIYRQIDSMSGDGRIVNYAGIVRGRTQRLVKLVLYQYQAPSDDADAGVRRSQPQTNDPNTEARSSIDNTIIDNTITELDQIIQGLIQGSKSLQFIRVEDLEFQANMERLSQTWKDLKINLEKFRVNPDTQNRDRLLQSSEAYWNLANQTVSSAEAFAKHNVEHTKRLSIFLFAVDLVVLAIILKISQSMRMRLKDTVNNLTISSTEISATITEQESLASQQAASVHETTATMTELRASCQQSTEQAQAAVTAAQQALQLAQTGTRAVGETLAGMSDMQQKVQAIAEQIVHLSAQANQIDSISEVVSELANRTNMLALNSSVEATRAGEHGKGFTIVANEIRKLADQSQQSADRISTLVADIQKAVNSTVMVTDEGTKTVRQGMQIAQNTEQAFAGVKESIDQVALNNQQVSLNIKQQFDAIQQVVQAMESLNKGASETAIGLTQTKTGTAHLNQAALVLQKMV